MHRWRPGARVVWGAALAAYVVAVLHRTSFGVAGVEAVDRFGIGATALSTFVVVQLAVYAGLQVPVGVLLDRFGSRRMIASGALLMAGGQLAIGLVDTPGPAIAARVLIGAGDAATFISVVRLVALWFPARRVPLVTQLTGIIGQLGQVAAALPLVAVLERRGWSTAFVGLAAVGVLAALLAALVVRDPPHGSTPVERESARAQLGGVLTAPGTWLGFWSHWVTQFPLNVFLLMWGYPFLTAGQGLTPGVAGSLMTLSVAATMVSGPVIGVLTGRHPLRRSWLVLASAVAAAAAWTIVLVRPVPSPVWVLALLVVVLGVGGPASVVGFDFARTSHPTGRVGTATGVVNVGGFAAALLSVLAIGVLLDLRAPLDGALSLDAFRHALAVLAVPWVVGVVGVLASRRSTRADMAARGVVVPPIRQALANRRSARRAAS